MHSSFVTYQSLRACRTFRNRQVITVRRLFLCPTVAVPVEVHDHRARTGQGLSRKAGASTISVTQIDERIIFKIRQRTITGDIPDGAVL